MLPHISRWVGWSVCSTQSHHPLQPPGCSYRSRLSRSSRVGRSETSELPGGFDMTADRGGNKTMAVESPALEESMSQLLRLLQRTSPRSLTSLQDPVPMETTGSRQFGTETEQRHLSRFWPCSSVSSSLPFLFSLLTF